MSYNLKGKKVLVTGAGGFIGSHLVERLVSLGVDTRAFIHYNALRSGGWLDESPARNDAQCILGDICDRDSLRTAMRDVEIVFHLAALIAIPYSYETPHSYVRTNIEGTLNVLQCARETNVERVIHTSTSEVYGTALYVPIKESHPLQGQSPYSASKIGADKIAESFNLSFDLPVVTVRPFNTFGPRQSQRAVLPTIISQCIKSDVISLGNVGARRDMNYITNTVDGFVLAGTSPTAVGKTIHFGSGVDVSISELVGLVGNIMNKKIDIQVDESRIRPKNSEVGRLVADNSMARDLLGWEPKVDLKEGLQLTIEWMKRNIGKYHGEIYVI